MQADTQDRRFRHSTIVVPVAIALGVVDLASSVAAETKKPLPWQVVTASKSDKLKRPAYMAGTMQKEQMAAPAQKKAEEGEEKESKSWFAALWPRGKSDKPKQPDYMAGPMQKEKMAGPMHSQTMAAPKQQKLDEGAEYGDRKWYSAFWPLGDKVEVKALKDEYVPFQTEKTDPKEIGQLPDRPKLAVEVGNGFLDTGNLHAGYEVPFIGAVWQPRLWAYAINRTAVQTFKDGRTGNPRETEIANRLDFFVNLQLTGTEKILLGLRPTDNNRPNEFTRYTFSGQSEGYNKEYGLNIETLFFEGDLGSLFPVLDKKGARPIDLGFTVGRQPVIFQEGILINDTIDAVGFIRNNIPFPGTSNLRISGMWGWNRLDRNDFDRRRDEADMFGLFIAADKQQSTLNYDIIYVNDEGNGDGLYFGFAAIQRLPHWGGISTAFRVNTSIALEDEIEGNVVGTGTLLTSEISKTVKGSDDIVYFNSFLGLGNFTQAGREAVVGGPLANTGILFASPNLSTYGAELDPFTTDSVIGGAIGYQAFWDNKRRNLILEVAGRHDLSGNGFDSYAVGAQLQQAVGRHVQLQFETYYAYNEDRDDTVGARAEIQIVY